MQPAPEGNAAPAIYVLSWLKFTASLPPKTTLTPVPIRQKQQWLSLTQQEKAEAKISKMAAGVIQPSESYWSSLLLLLRKNMAPHSNCIDYNY